MTGWILRIAARDSRGSRRRLLMFVLSMSIGVAALVAVMGFAANLRTAVVDEALALLGADLGLESDSPFADSTETVIASIGGRQSRRTSFASMVYFPQLDATRIASVRAVEGGYPFYGAFETNPRDASAAFRRDEGALIDRSIQSQFGLHAGDTLRVGSVSYRILGVLERQSSESAFESLVYPRIYVPLARVDTTLLAFGSRVDYEVFFRFDDGSVPANLVSELDEVLPRTVEIHTVEREQEAWSEAFRDLYGFLGLVALTALLLGSIGVASAIHVHIQQRKQTIAVLRCIGASPGAAARVYLVQALFLGLVGAAIGAAAGVALQYAVPAVLADALPFEVTMRLYGRPVLAGLVVGVGITMLFASLPLLGVRYVSPLEALRSNVERAGLPAATRRPRYWATAAAAFAGCLAAGALLAPTPMSGIAYVLGVAVVIGILYGVAFVGTWLVRRAVPRSMPYVVRQGLANLHRPNNQTRLVLLAVGFGAFLVFTLLIIRQTLLEQVRIADEGGRPNLIMFDVQPDQRAGVRERISEAGLPIVEEVPIVGMRLESVRGRSVREAREGENESDWAVDREYRSTWRDHLTATEELVEGEFTSTWSGSGPVPVSVEEDVASELDVDVGDEIAFNVHGRIIDTEVGSIRRVDWSRMRTNFFVVFPDGVLESAPQTWVFVTRTAGAEESGAVQASIVRDYPNVSTVDLALIVDVLERLFAQLAAVIRFMAFFSIATGLAILAGSIVVSRYRRIEEIVLLKTLGASRADIRWISGTEYLALGVLASVVGLGLSLIAGWLLARYLFEAPLALPAAQLVVATATAAALTVVIGVLNSRGVYRAPALDVLRESG